MTLGAELIIDPGLDNPAAWTGDPEWSVVVGGARCIDGNNDIIEPAVALVVKAGYIYQVIFELVTRTEGRIRPIIGGTNGTERTVEDIYTEIIIATNTGNLQFQGFGLHEGVFSGFIDNVSVKEVIQGFVG